MSRIIILGATGSLGSHVLRQALDIGHQVTAFVRSPERLPTDLATMPTVLTGDLKTIPPFELAQLVKGHDALINCAGYVTDGWGFVDLVDQLATSLGVLHETARPVCWFLAGAALLDIDPSGRRGCELPKIRSTYWPHQTNFNRLLRTDLDWRLLCPGPMVDQPGIGLDRLRLSLDVLPVAMPSFTNHLPDWLVLPLFAHRIPEMILPFADAAALMLANIEAGGPLSRRRIGLALPAGMRGRKPRRAAKPGHRA